jgi:Uncharacterized protein conserved in bacteria (DUF2130)
VCRENLGLSAPPAADRFGQTASTTIQSGQTAVVSGFEEIDAISVVEKFSDVQADLDRERKTMTRLWAKREAQMDGVVDAAVGMYGDLQGIAGRALQEIEGLQHPLLEGVTGENDD